MTQFMSIVSFQGKLTKVLTTTYKSGHVSKRYLDSATGLPFHVEWLKPESLFPWDNDWAEDEGFSGALVTNPVKPRLI